jgi:hypothetical protein
LAEAPHKLDKLMAALSRRTALAGSAEEQLSARMDRWIGALQEEYAGTAVDGKLLPPRRVATAMTAAIVGQPHLAVTFRRPTDTMLCEPLLLDPESMEKALGVPVWEVDDIREDVDRRVRVALKQAAILHWLWSRFGLPKNEPDALFRVLVPGAPPETAGVGMMRRGSQLYMVVDDEPLDDAALYMGWIAKDAAFPPDGFAGKWVDQSLLKAAARALGGDIDEIADLLDRSVTIVPRSCAKRLVATDRWRSRGWATLTGLGSRYGASRWLSAPVLMEQIDWRRSIGVHNDKLVITRPTEIFDLAALPRVQAMYRQLVAWMLASLESNSIDNAPLDLVDVGTHMKAVLAPLLAWPTEARTAQHLARETGVGKAEAKRALLELRKDWKNHYQARWLSRFDGKASVQSTITAHLLGTYGSLRTLFNDGHQRHHEVLRLFVATYAATAPVQRLWNRGLSDMPSGGTGTPPPEDVVGAFFTSMMEKTLQAQALEPESPLGPDTLDDIT